MADTTFGVKVPEELKEQITKLMQDSGLTGRDFMQNLINMYQVEKTKDSIPEVAQELKELQVITQRINNIYLNLGYRIDNITKAKDLEVQQLLSKKEFIIADIQMKNEIMEDENQTLKESYNDIVNSKNELFQRVNELTESNNNYKALIDEYKNRIDTLSGIVEEYKGYKSENDELKKHLELSRDKNAELSNEIKDKDRELQALNSAMEAFKNKHEEEVKQLHQKAADEIKSLKSKHIDDLEQVRNKAEFDKEKVLLDKEVQHQEEIRKLNERINTLNAQYNEKVKDLISELEDLHKRNKTKPADNQSKKL